VACRISEALSLTATTAIYADATGPEEKQLAERMWLHYDVPCESRDATSA